MTFAPDPFERGVWAALAFAAFLVAWLIALP